MASILNKMMQYLGFADDIDPQELPTQKSRTEDETSQENQPLKRPQVVGIHSQKNVKVVLCEPESYEDVQTVADHLRSKRPVVLNLEGLPNDQALRIVDFISGTVYALGGKLEKISRETFLCTPDNVDVQGGFRSLASNNADRSVN